MWWADIEVPNSSVDVDSWEESACYPRRTFYPLSDGPSIRIHRITMTYFRICSNRRSRSQAGFCHCTLTIDFRPIWANLRTPPLLFGRRPPQSNYPPCRVQFPASRKLLDIRTLKGGISTMTPPKLASQVHSLPPILHRNILIPLQSYSKGARGLSV